MLTKKNHFKLIKETSWKNLIFATTIDIAVKEHKIMAIIYNPMGILFSIGISVVMFFLVSQGFLNLGWQHLMYIPLIWCITPAFFIFPSYWINLSQLKRIKYAIQ